MLTKAFKRAKVIIEDPKLSTVLFWIILLALFIRFPFFFRDYVDRDESTFILVAQSWVEGHLPYTQLWDVKPPFTFLFFTGIIAVFGKSLFAIRFFGTLLVVISSFFTYRIGVLVTTKKAAFIGALSCVALQSLFGSLQGVMSEHIAMAFFMPALYILVKPTNIRFMFLAGALLGISVMTKLNLAYALLFLGLFLLIEGAYQKKYKRAIICSMAYGAGIVLLIILAMLPYYLQDHLSLWWKSVIQAPLEYASARRYSIFKMAPFLLVLSAFFLYTWKRKLVDYKNRTTLILTIAIIGVGLSFVKGGRINGHYLIQLHPILIILVAVVLQKIKFVGTIKVKPYWLMLLLLIPMESYLEYINIVKNKIERNTFYNGEGISVPKYIQESQLQTTNILFLGYHIGYWRLGVNPPTKAATHPSNICKEEMFSAYDNPRKTSMEELQYIMEVLQPKTIVTRKNRRVFDKKEIEENEYIDAYLRQHYKVHATIEQAEVLQRLE